jgi:heme/copper-type cytochrome/quinol oxidase subunit 2
MHLRSCRRVVRPLLATAAAVLVLSGCGGDAGDAVVVDVALGNYTIEPATLVLPADVEVELNVTNVDTGMIHSLVAAGKGTRTLQPGESQTLPMGVLTAGRFQMWCDVPGHAQMGQAGTVVVEPAEPASDT